MHITQLKSYIKQFYNLQMTVITQQKTLFRHSQFIDGNVSIHETNFRR